MCNCSQIQNMVKYVHAFSAINVGPVNSSATHTEARRLRRHRRIFIAGVEGIGVEPGSNRHREDELGAVSGSDRSHRSETGWRQGPGQSRCNPGCQCPWCERSGSALDSSRSVCTITLTLCSVKKITSHSLYSERARAFRSAVRKLSENSNTLYSGVIVSSSDGH